MMVSFESFIFIWSLQVASFASDAKSHSLSKSKVNYHLKLVSPKKGSGASSVTAALFSWQADNFIREASQGVFKRKLCTQGANTLKSC